MRRYRVVAVELPVRIIGRKQEHLVGTDLLDDVGDPGAAGDALRIAFIGKPNAAINKGASGTANVYQGTASSDSIISSMQISSVYNRTPMLALAILQRSFGSTASRSCDRQLVVPVIR
jgi:hypothetical protein